MAISAESKSQQRTARWTSLLHGATNELMVVTLVREYLQTWTPSELEPLPVVIDALQVQSGQDVSDLAVELTRAELKYSGQDRVGETLSEITTVVREAAARFPRFSWEAKLLSSGNQ